jgi:L-ribulokinase
MPKYALGYDYGTSSVRALLVDLSDGKEVATHVYAYPSGDDGVLYDPRDPNLARQNPADYVEGFFVTTKAVMVGINPADVVGIGVDTTGSTPLPVDAEGLPLALNPKWKGQLAAHAWLWKDHTGHAEAAEITKKASEQGWPYLAKCGGTYSSEWFWSKILRCARIAPEVFEAAHSWMELADFVPAYLTGTLQNPARSACAAGHKAMFNAEWGGLPADDFLKTLDPRLVDLRSRLYTEVKTSDQVAGRLTEEVAARAGLLPGTVVAVGAFDAHMGAVGSGIAPGCLVKIMGTSTCDCLVHPLDQELADIPGLCGIVPGSVLPDAYGLEAGQSAVGDLFNWVVSLTGKSHEELTEGALALKPGASGLLALDWNNGNRTILVDPRLTGLLIGQTLHTTPAELYRAAIEATAFGAFTIVKRLEEYGVSVSQIVNCGGIAEKSPLTMQIYADVMNRPMKVVGSVQTCALGAALFGAVAAGHFASTEAAQQALVPAPSRTYTPDLAAVKVYEELFTLYTLLHDAFGRSQPEPAELSLVMKRLIAVRDQQR